LCNKNGEPFFNEQDVDELSQLDSLAIDVLVNAIEEWASKRAGKVQGRSKG
jgi:hypothetical protein